jgi:hypothetical protein
MLTVRPVSNAGPAAKAGAMKPITSYIAASTVASTVEPDLDRDRAALAPTRTSRSRSLIASVRARLVLPRPSPEPTIAAPILRDYPYPAER